MASTLTTIPEGPVTPNGMTIAADYVYHMGLKETLSNT
jgi:hypothetical protein